MSQITVKDKDFGDVTYRRSSRARQYSITLRAKQVTVVIPLYGNHVTAKDFLDEFRERIKWRLSHQEEIVEARKQDNELLAEARAYLPGRLKELADKYGLIYYRLTLRNSKTRWGSCSSKKNINLSIYLMNLPKHLIDYVMLHELCHLTHMNHSPAFWELLDKYTGNKAKELRQELKRYSCS